jgi:hypothetical protein
MEFAAGFSTSAVPGAGSGAGSVAEAATFDLGFAPPSLSSQCRSLIESYHELHGYGCLPDTLWKCRLAKLIEGHQVFRQLLRKASTTRSAKRSNESFVEIATTILALEILASSFAGWSTLYPDAAAKAGVILQGYARSPHMPLMEFYLYPPKTISLAAIAALAPPANRLSDRPESVRVPTPQLSGERWARAYASAIL